MILVALGSNLPSRAGDSRSTIEAALDRLGRPPLRLIARSRLWRTRPVPDNGDPWFTNAVAAVETALDPQALLDHLHDIERALGRERHEPNAPRTLDLDLLDYHGRIAAHPALPHPRMAERAFVLRPLAEIAPDWTDPRDGRSLATLIAALPPDGDVIPLGDTGRARVMGIVNATPDSFSGDGYVSVDLAIAHGLALLDQGAHMLDIGGESTRPGASTVAIEEEIRRVAPVVAALAPAAREAGAIVSVDTRNAATMRAALAAGASMINDVSALTHDPASAALLAGSECAVVLMHMRGTPATMQNDPHYDNVVEEVFRYLESRVAAAVRAGIARDRLTVDPGIGFGKTPAHNIALLRGIPRLKELGLPLMIGVSRKAFIGRIGQGEFPTRRLGGSLAAGLYAASRGADILRVHDVAETVQALALWSVLESGID